MLYVYLYLVSWHYLRCCDFDYVPIRSRHLSRSVASLMHQLCAALSILSKHWTRSLQFCPFAAFIISSPASVFCPYCFFRTMWSKNLIFLSAILFVNIKADTIIVRFHLHPWHHDHVWHVHRSKVTQLLVAETSVYTVTLHLCLPYLMLK